MVADGEDTVTLHEPGAFVGRLRVCLLLSHRRGVELIVLSPGEARVVGREAPAETVIDDESLSRRHARVEYRDGQLLIEDLGSKNGTFVNGERLRARAPISAGDEVLLGGLHLAVQGGADSAEALEGHDRFVGQLEEQSVRARLRQHHLSLLFLRSAAPGQPLARWLSPLQRRLRRALATPFGLGLYGGGRLQLWIAEAEPAKLAELESTIVAPAGGVALIGGGACRFGAAAEVDELYLEAQAALRRAQADGGLRWIISPAASGDEATFTGRGVAMEPVYRAVQRVACATIPVLIQGETGTGKEVVARAIHRGSARRQRPLRCINCGAIPQPLLESALFGHERGAFTGADELRKGIFEEAEGGTVLLDEVGELSPAAQVALLRVLENKRLMRVGSSDELAVDVRVLAATHRNLEAMCEEGGFRLDLLYRLNAMTIELPPLRDRLDELPALAQFFLDQARTREGGSAVAISDAASEHLLRYTWPGNLRELRNVITRALIIAVGDRVEPADLPDRVTRIQRAEPKDEALGFRERIQRYEAALIVEALDDANWNQSEAARQLHMPLRTMVRKIRAYGLSRK